MLLPRTLHEAFTSSTSESTGEAMVMLAAVVTREGRVSNVELIGSKWVGTENGEADVLDAVSKARFEPARQDGLPVAVNMVWMMTHTTVRATADAPARGRTTARRRTA
jgi:TonB family protein